MYRAVCVVRSIGLAYTAEIGELRQALGRGFGLADALLREIDARHPTREQRTGVRGDAVADEHEPRRRLRFVLFGRVAVASSGLGRDIGGGGIRGRLRHGPSLPAPRVVLQSGSGACAVRH